jgi:hypothetical protein
MPRQLSARVDRSLAQDVMILRRTGLSYSEMIKMAIHLLAMVCHTAWINRVVEPGEMPELIAYKYRMTPKPRPIEGELTLEETPDEDRSPLRPDVPRPRTAGLPDLELAGLGLRDAPTGNPARQGEVRARLPRPDQAVRR